ncbi:MAG: radical SAM protein, partial [Bacillota bacterium]
ALRFDGVHISAEDAIAEIEKDMVFFGKDGGVTLSGGECMASPDFTLEVLTGCRQRGIGTNIETSLYASAETVEAIADLCDRVIADIKLMDPVRHRAGTGVDNALILSNIRRLAKRGTNLLLRTPLIPGYTDDPENIAAIARFIAKLDADIPLELLNFNPMFTGKYKALGLECKFSADKTEIPQEWVDMLKQIVTDHGVRVL